MLRILIVLWLVALLAGLVWWFWKGPGLSFASFSPEPPELNTDTMRQVISDIDHEIARGIKKVSEDGVSLPQVGSFSQLGEIKSTTVSATVSTTPEELWQAVREEGAQSVISTLAGNANVTVGNVSANVVNDARYQYCKGVVDEYERQR